MMFCCDWCGKPAEAKIQWAEQGYPDWLCFAVPHRWETKKRLGTEEIEVICPACWLTIEKS